MMKRSSNAAKRRLESLVKRNPRLTPDAVVDDARNPKSPLHPHFEWDDAKAGHAHRLYQARRLIASVQVKYTYETMQLNGPVYVRDPTCDAGEQGYATSVSVRSDKQKAQMALGQEIDRMLAAVARARGVALALGLEADRESVVDRVFALRAAAA